MKERMIDVMARLDREAVIEECARVALREDLPLSRLAIYTAIRALKDKA